MSLPYRAEPQTLYRATDEWVRLLRSYHDHLHAVCGQCLHRPVRVETVDGDVFEGTIVHCDRGIVYLMQPAEQAVRAPFFFPGPNPNFILPLVLFNLLAITLI